VAPGYSLGMELNATNIAAAAAELNRDYPEAGPLLATATAVLRVSVATADRYGNAYRYIVTPTMVDAEGGHIDAAEGTVVTFRRRDGRENMRAEGVARRAARKAYPAGWAVPLLVVDRTMAG
jgi:hypothetical protein